MFDSKNNLLCLVACTIGGALARLMFRRKPASDIELLEKINSQFVKINQRLNDIGAAQVECNNRVSKLSEHHVDNVSEIKSSLENIISRDNTVVSAIDKLSCKTSNIDSIVSKIPSNIEEITKKYSMYLHDEHVQLHDTISKQSRFQKTLSLPPSPRVSELLREQSKGQAQKLLPLGQANRSTHLKLTPIYIPKST